MAFDLAAETASAECIYLTEKVADQPVQAGQFSTNGLVKLLALDSRRFLLVERSFSVGVGNRIRIYEVSLAGATDVSAVQALQGVIQNFTPVSKTLILDLDVLGLTLDNIEGVTFGPLLENGQRSLILCSDNNFSATQFTQFLAFALQVTPGS